VALSTRMAIESERLTTDVIMVNLFPYLAIRYQVTDVPTTVINGRNALAGPRAEAEYLPQILAAADPGRG
jgi:hypothetical protein